MVCRSLPAILTLLIAALVLPVAGARDASAVPRNVEQLIVAIATTWDSNRALLWTFDRQAGGPWIPQSGPVPVLLGKKGLAWGRGVVPNPEGTMKQEGDWRTPAGLFRIGRIYGYPERLPGSDFPYHQVGPFDAWVDDPGNPWYNQHVEVKPGQEPEWFESQRMRLGDYAYKYKVEIRHNSDPPVPGYGSAIFFHIRRGPDRPTAGCTTMAEEELVRLMRWLDESRNPHYVILPQAEYDRLKKPWGLPEFR